MCLRGNRASGRPLPPRRRMRRASGGSVGGRAGDGRSPSAAAGWFRTARVAQPLVVKTKRARSTTVPGGRGRVHGGPQGCKPCYTAGMATAEASADASVAEVRAGPITAMGAVGHRRRSCEGGRDGEASGNLLTDVSDLPIPLLPLFFSVDSIHSVASVSAAGLHLPVRPE